MSVSASSQRTSLMELVRSQFTASRLRLAVLVAATWVLAVYGGKAVSAYGYTPWFVNSRDYEPPAWLTFLALALLLVSIRSLWLAYSRPMLATALALLPFHTLLVFGSSWVLWWVVAQAVVLMVAASRSRVAAIVPALGMVASWLLIAVNNSTMVVWEGTYYRFESPGLFMSAMTSTISRSSSRCRPFTSRANLRLSRGWCRCIAMS